MATKNDLVGGLIGAGFVALWGIDSAATAKKELEHERALRLQAEADRRVMVDAWQAQKEHAEALTSHLATANLSNANLNATIGGLVKERDAAKGDALSNALRANRVERERDQAQARAERAEAETRELRAQLAAAQARPAPTEG